jgi:hypothetical protein
MALETLFRRPLLSSLFIQTGNDKPRRPHWIGDRQPADPQQAPTPGQAPEEHRVSRQDPRGYRELATITLGEVQDAYHFFANQLLPSPYESWIAKDYFSMLELVRRRDGRPPAVFGRVKACFPSDGYIHNVQEMELLFPRRNGKPEILSIHADDILFDPARPVQSYCVRVKFFATDEDIADFDQDGNTLLERGFQPEFVTGYLDLLEMNQQDHTGYPWLYVASSRWFASIPASVQPEVRERLKDLLQWNKLVFNYHPESLPPETRTLNRELGFKYGFTDMVLIEPADPAQTGRIIASAFDRLFEQPIR